MHIVRIEAYKREQPNRMNSRINIILTSLKNRLSIKQYTIFQFSLSFCHS